MIGFGIAGRPRRRWLALGDPRRLARPTRHGGCWAGDRARRCCRSLANSFGWIFTEMGRQPWVVFGLMTTAHAVSPSVSTGGGLDLDDRLHRCCTACSPVVEVRLLRALRPQGRRALRRTHPTRPTTPTTTGRSPSRTERSDVMELTTSGSSSSPSCGSATSCLEGFDFGVGMLLPVLGPGRPRAPRPDQHHRPGLGRQRGLAARRGRRDLRRLPRVVRHAVLRLLPAAAAHPASRSSSRGVGVRVPRTSGPSDAWQRGWDRAIFSGSLVPALLWGVAFANIVRGVPIDADKEYVGSLFDLLNPYALLGGLTTLLAVPHPRRDVRRAEDGRRRSGTERAGSGARVGLVTAVAGRRVPGLDPGRARRRRAASCGRAVVAAVALVLGRRAPTGRARGLGVPGTFVAHRARGGRPLPRRCSRTSCRRRSTRRTASRPPTPRHRLHAEDHDVVALVFTPLVLLYQGWTYWVFRKRIAVITSPPEPGPNRPVDAPDRCGGGAAEPRPCGGPHWPSRGRCWVSRQYAARSRSAWLLPRSSSRAFAAGRSRCWCGRSGRGPWWATQVVGTGARAGARVCGSLRRRLRAGWREPAARTLPYAAAGTTLAARAVTASTRTWRGTFPSSSLRPSCRSCGRRAVPRGLAAALTSW